MPSRASKSTSLSEGCVLGAAFGGREGRQNARSKDRVWERSLQLPGSRSQINQRSDLLVDQSPNMQTKAKKVGVKPTSCVKDIGVCLWTDHRENCAKSLATLLTLVTLATWHWKEPQRVGVLCACLSCRTCFATNMLNFITKIYSWKAAICVKTEGMNKWMNENIHKQIDLGRWTQCLLVKLFLHPNTLWFNETLLPTGEWNLSQKLSKSERFVAPLCFHLTFSLWGPVSPLTPPFTPESVIFIQGGVFSPY